MPRRVVVAMVVGWSLARLLSAAAVAGADTGPAAPDPRPNHIGVVVTPGEVFVSWKLPAGANPKAVVVRRGEPVCPRTPADGTGAGEVSPLHVIDQAVSAGKAYCYTVFLTRRAGGATIVASTGPVTVPDTRSVPPAHAVAPAPITTTSPGHIDRALVKRVALGAGAALVAALVLVGLLRGARRVGDDRQVLRPTMRGSLASRNSGALVVPAMIALGWVVVVIGFVILR
ncbi:MAG: hypothetical protein ACXVQJ_03510 [Actinomycetota bacterium]